MRKKYFSMVDQMQAKLASNRKTSKGRIKPTKKGKPKLFIAWDGEGYTEENIHKYVFLMNNKSGHILNSDGLPSIDCFNYLCDTALEFPGYVHVGFALSYDVNMMLKDLPRASLERLHKTGKVYWKQFSIEYKPKKYLELKRYPENIYIHNTRRKPDSIITLWDVFGFFQGSFLHALDTFFNEEEKKKLGYTTIKAGKERRNEFSLNDIEDMMVPYTILEVDALTALMDRLYNQYCLNTNPQITLRRFDGAGAIADSLLRTYKVRRYYPQDIKKKESNKTPIPEEVMLASQHAYGGGRIELMKYGHITTIHHYDSNKADFLFNAKKLYRYDLCSAYPSENVDLIDLSSGSWEHFNSGDMSPTKKDFSLYLIQWDYTNNPVKPFYPFFYRSFAGDITFPQYGYNWVWCPELLVAIKHNDKLQGRINIIEKWLYTPDNPEIRPYGFIHDMYKIRRDLKKAGNGMQICYKLGYNSFYGKTVQHLGYDDHSKRGDKKWRPPFYQLQYGGYITSGIRARMFDAAMQKPEHTIGMATDGLWTTEQLDLPVGNELGQWEYEELMEGTFVQSGVYWTHSFSDKPVKVPCPKHGIYCDMVQHYRGFDKKYLTETSVLEAWSRNEISLSVPTTRFITLGQGLMLKDFDLWHTWHECNRLLKIEPDNTGKRSMMSTKKKSSPLRGLIPTTPNNSKVGFDGNTLVISDPFPLPWESARTEYDGSRQAVILERETVDAIEDRYES